MITKLGKQKLESDLAALKEELRLTYEKRSEAAAEGDLKENSAYIFMGERAGVLNTQIEEVLTDLAAEVIAVTPTHTDYICFGHEVTVLFENDQRQMSIVLVGKNDARLKSNWISCDSPIGLALLGKKPADKVLVNEQPVKILSITIAEIE